jgi:hypothetical protein
MRNLTLTLVLGTVLAGQSVTSVDDGRIAEITARLVPLVERYAGRSFVEPPAVLLSDAREVGEALEVEFRICFQQMVAEDEQDRLDWFIRKEAHTIAAQMIGKYAYVEDLLFVVPPTLALIASNMSLSDRTANELLELTVAHELVHALQDQEVDLAARIRSAGYNDQLHGLNALIEGHAMFVASQVARHLGMLETYGKSLEVIAPDGDLGAATAQSAFGLRSRRMLHTYYYVTGAQRIAELHDKGGSDLIWATLAAPPPRSSAIFRTWNDGIPAAGAEPIDLLGSLQGAEAIFGDRNWLTMRIEVGHAQLRSECSNVEDIDQTLQGLRGGATVDCQLRGSSQLGQLTLLEFDNPERARRFAEQSELSTRIDSDRLDGHGHEFADVETASPLRGRRYSQRPTTRKVQLLGGLHWFVSGPHVLQIFSAGFLVEDEVATATARSIFDRLAR